MVKVLMVDREKYRTLLQEKPNKVGEGLWVVVPHLEITTFILEIEKMRKGDADNVDTVLGLWETVQNKPAAAVNHEHTDRSITKVPAKDIFASLNYILQPENSEIYPDQFVDQVFYILWEIIQNPKNHLKLQSSNSLLVVCIATDVEPNALK